MLKEELTARLGDYYHIGFTLSEVDDHFLELHFMGQHVGYFGNTSATIEAIRQSCQEYLKQHEFSVEAAHQT